jgi:hypothetical protein
LHACEFSSQGACPSQAGCLLFPLQLACGVSQAVPAHFALPQTVLCTVTACSCGADQGVAHSRDYTLAKHVHSLVWFL